MFVEEAILIHYEHIVGGYDQRRTKSKEIPAKVHINAFLPKVTVFNSEWGHDFEKIIFDYRIKSNAYELCLNYIKDFPKFEISDRSAFLIKYKTIALIHTFNEKNHIKGVIKNLEEICDGIIILDDGSEDITYEWAQSSKIICKIKKEKKEFNELENKNILLDIASFISSEWMFFIDADERFYLFGKSLQEILPFNTKACCIYLIHLWDEESKYRTDVPEGSPISKPGVLHRWRFFRNIGRCQINSNLKFHFLHTPFQDFPVNILPILILHYGMLSNSVRKRKYRNYLQVDTEQNHKNYTYFLDNGVTTSDVDELIKEMVLLFEE